MQLDELDRKIVKLLGADGGLNNNEVAKALEVSEGTVRNRTRKLLDGGALKVSGLVNPDAITEKQVVFLGVKIAVSKDLDRVARRLSELPGVLSVSITTGRYDLILEAWLNAKYGLIEFISSSLAPVEGIVSTESFLTMRSYGKWVVDNEP